MESKQRKKPVRAEAIINHALSDGTLEAMAKAGATYEQIAQSLNISRRSLYRWMQKNPTLLETIKRSQAVIIAKLWAGVDGLTKDRIITLKETKTKTHKDKLGNVTGVVEITTERQIFCPAVL